MIPTAAAPTDDGLFIVELERFHGPLDLLLHLIRAQDIDIFDIPIAQITSQFLAVVATPDALELDRAGEFLEMAAVLVRIKAQMLLPRHGAADVEGEDPRAELVRRLLEYEHFRDVARHLEDAETDRVRHYPRGFIPPRREPVAEVEEPPLLEVTWPEVWAAALEVGARYREPHEHHILRRPVSVDEKIALIVRELGHQARVEFRRLVVPFGDKLHAVATLMAGLELSKQRRLAMRQQEPFAPLWFLRREPQEEDADHAVD
ncbi:MAG: segregation and condensation protein A [Longimicrobiales bacterium]